MHLKNHKKAIENLIINNQSELTDGLILNEIADKIVAKPNDSV